MEKSKLKMEKFRITKLKNLTKIKGGAGDDTFVKECKENSKVWENR